MKMSKLALFASLTAWCAVVTSDGASSQEAFRDDFTGLTLRPEWRIVSEEKDRWALIEGDYLLSVSSESSSNIFIYQRELPEDYDVILRVLAKLNGTPPYAHRPSNRVYLSVAEDKENMIVIEARGDGSIIFNKALKGEWSVIERQVGSMPEDISLKIMKRGVDFEAAYSFDGSIWENLGKQFFIEFKGKPTLGTYDYGEIADTGVRIDYFEVVPR